MPWVKDEGVQSIRDRPQAINTRDTTGHLEADSIVGKRNEPDKILVIIDRASRFVRLGLVRHGTAAEVASLFAKCRQYIPKGVSLRDVTQAKLDWVALQLNSRVRKRLGWKSPLTVLSEMTDRTVKSKANLPFCSKLPAVARLCKPCSAISVFVPA